MPSPSAIALACEVRFTGSFKTLSWTQPDYENWHGVQAGAPATQ